MNTCISIEEKKFSSSFQIEKKKSINASNDIHTLYHCPRYITSSIKKNVKMYLDFVMYFSIKKIKLYMD